MQLTYGGRLLTGAQILEDGAPGDALEMADLLVSEPDSGMRMNH